MKTKLFKQKSHFLTLIITVIAITLCNQHTISQCDINNATYSGIDMGTPPCGTFDYATITAGDYILVDVVSGVRYQFTTCGATFDTQMTGYPDAGGPSVFFNDDNGALCLGTAASVDWTADFTGQLRILITKFFCVGDGTPVDIGVSIVNVINFSSPTSNGTTINRCLSSSNLTLAATPAGGTFSGAGVTGNSFSPSTAGIGLHEIIYQSTYCTQSIFINVIPDLAVGNITGGSDVCAGGDPDEMTIAPSGGSGIYSYQWFSENGTNCPLVSGAAIPGATGPTYDPPAGLMNTTTYRVRVISSSAGGCSATLFSDNCITVTVAADLPTPTITGNSSFCSGGSTILSAPAGYTYLWSNGETTETISVSAAGNYTVTIDDGSGCTATSDPFEVTVNPNPTPIITQVSSCGGSVVELSATAGFSSYLWSPSGAITENITVTSSGSHSVTVTDANGCSGVSSNSSVIIDPTVVIIGHLGVFACESITLTPINSSDNYLWSPGGTTTPTLTVSSSGSYSVEITDLNGCVVARETFSIAIRPLINANIDVNFCNGETTITLTGGSPEVIGDDYIVTNNGNGIFNGLPITHGQSFSVTGLNNGSWIDFTVSDSYGCSYHFEQFVVLDASAPDVVCPGSQPQIPLTGCAGIVPDYTDLLSVSDACNFTITQVAPTPGTILAPGSMGNVLFTVIDEMGNTSVCSLLYNVANDTENPIAVCQDISLPLNSSGTASFTTDDINNGSSDNCGISSMTMNHSGNFDCSDIGDHLVELTLVDAAGNSATCQSTVTVIDPNVPTASGGSGGSDITICYGDDVILNGSFGGSATDAFWASSGDGSFDDPSLPNATYTHGLSDYVTGVILTYTTYNSPCAFATDTVLLTITAVEITGASGTDPTCQGDDGYISFILTHPFTDHTVSFEVDGIPTSVNVTTDAVGNAVIPNLSDGNYTNFSFLAQNGCSNSSDISWVDITLLGPISPTPPLMVDTTLCEGTAHTLLGVPSSGGVVHFYSDAALTNLLSVDQLFLSAGMTGSHTFYATEEVAPCMSTAVEFTVTFAPCSIPCTTPTLTTGTVVCDSITNTYSVTYTSTANNVSADNGATVTPTHVIGIPFEVDVIITASNGTGCEVSQTITGLSGCPTDCVYPELIVGQGVCDGTNFYSVAFTSNGMNTMASEGDIVGNSVINIPIGTPVTITSENGACITSTTVQSPDNCDNPCANAPISVAGAVCATDGSAFYSVSFVTQPGTIVYANQGTVTPNAIVGIPSGVDVTIIAFFTGCDTTTIDIDAPTCPECTTPSLTTGPVVCDSITNTYSVAYTSTANNVTADNGATVTPTHVIGIPFEVDVIITASNGTGCEVSQTITGLSGCPTDCVYPELIVGQGVCDGTNFYSVAFTSNGMNTMASEGDIVGNSVINIPIGTPVTITSENGACITSTTVQSPDNCDNPCANAPISVAGAVCATDGSAFYSVSFVTQPGTIVYANQGTVTPNAIVGIPSGVDVTIIAFFTGCDTTTIDIEAPTCPECTAIPVGDTLVQFCNNAIEEIIVTGTGIGEINWYTDVALTNLVATGNSYLPNNIAGTTIYYITENTSSCVSNSLTVVVIIYEMPKPIIDLQHELCPNIDAYVTASGLGNEFHWFTDNELTNQIASGENFSPPFNEETTYYYIVNINGTCVSDPVQIIIDFIECPSENDFNIPTAFTPNGDGINDYWEIPGLNEKYPNNEVYIYNRWGNLLFESKGYQTAWDGLYNGQELPVASYYFVIMLNNPANEKITGTVTIVKKR